MIKNGRSPKESVAVITKATMPDQKVLETNLGDCAEKVNKNGIEPPAMIVVGKIVSLRGLLKWKD